MSEDILMHIPEIPGESVHDAKEGWINIQSLNFGGSNPVTVKSTGGLSGGKVVLSDINIMKVLDKTSSPIFKALCTGTHFPKVVIVCLKQTGDASTQVYYEMELSDCMISSQQTSGGSGSGELNESVSLTFRAIKQTYSFQGADNKLTKATPVSWDQTSIKAS